MHSSRDSGNVVVLPRPDGELRHVPPQDLHQYWPFIKEGLEEVRNHSVDGWIAEDVYSAIRTGSSTLHVAFISGTYAGFCVLTVMQGYSSKALHIWCAYGAHGANVIQRFESELIKIALNCGARKLTFLSPRKGWGKYYKAINTVYEKELICQADHQIP
jgi:hypothetical protein